MFAPRQRHGRVERRHARTVDQRPGAQHGACERVVRRDTSVSLDAYADERAGLWQRDQG